MIAHLYVAQIGIVAGLMMVVQSIILSKIKFSTLDLTSYMGCLLTGHSSGKVNFIAGFSFHMLASVVLAWIYVYCIDWLQVAITLRHALYAGLIHTVISGICMHFFDQLNPCIAQGSIKRLGYLTYNYGVSSIITFALGHILYAIVIFMALAR